MAQENIWVARRRKASKKEHKFWDLTPLTYYTEVYRTLNVKLEDADNVIFAMVGSQERA